MKFLVLFIFLLIACNTKHPHQNVIDNLKTLNVIEEEFSLPFSENFKLVSYSDSLEIFCLLNGVGTGLSGNLYIPKKNIFYDLKGKIDVTGSFIVNVYNYDNQIVDTLKGYFIQDQIKCALASNYENIFIGTQWKSSSIPVKLYSLKLSGKSENYAFNPKPQLFVHHTFLALKDTQFKIFNSELTHIFFHQNFIKSDSIYPKMSKEIFSFKDTFELQMKLIKSPISVDSLNTMWMKSFEVVYNQDSILSFYFLNLRKEGTKEMKIFKPMVYDFRKNRFLTSEDLPSESHKKDIEHFLYFPNFIRLWKTNGKIHDISYTHKN